MKTVKLLHEKCFIFTRVWHLWGLMANIFTMDGYSH